jgi:hypothetical protein
VAVRHTPKGTEKSLDDPTALKVLAVYHKRQFGIGRQGSQVRPVSKSFASEYVFDSIKSETNCGNKKGER